METNKRVTALRDELHDAQAAFGNAVRHLERAEARAVSGLDSDAEALQSVRDWLDSVNRCRCELDKAEKAYLDALAESIARSAARMAERTKETP